MRELDFSLYSMTASYQRLKGLLYRACICATGYSVPIASPIVTRELAVLVGNQVA